MNYRHTADFSEGRITAAVTSSMAKYITITPVSYTHLTLPTILLV